MLALSDFQHCMERKQVGIRRNDELSSVQRMATTPDLSADCFELVLERGALSLEQGKHPLVDAHGILRDAQEDCILEHVKALHCEITRVIFMARHVSVWSQETEARSDP